MMKAVIPIAGKGTRFLPATKQVPKELLPILNIPMLHHVVQEALSSGLEQIIFVTSSGKQEVENFYDRNWELEEFLMARAKTQELELVREIGSMANIATVRQKQALGLGHAILCARDLIGKDENFAVLLGDDLTVSEDVPVTKQLWNISQCNQGAAVIGVMEIPLDDSDKYGVIKGNEMAENLYRMSGMIEKPPAEKAPSNLASPGRYILPYKIFEVLEEISPGAGGELQLTDAINRLCENEEEIVLAYRFKGERYDTGNVKGHLNATLEFALKDNDLREYTIALMRDKVEKYG